MQDLVRESVESLSIILESGNKRQRASSLLQRDSQFKSHKLKDLNEERNRLRGRSKIPVLKSSIVKDLNELNDVNMIKIRTDSQYNSKEDKSEAVSSAKYIGGQKFTFDS